MRDLILKFEIDTCDLLTSEGERLDENYMDLIRLFARSESGVEFSFGLMAKLLRSAYVYT